MSIIDCNVYLLHYELLNDRLEFMKNQLESLKINYELITEEPPNDWIQDSPASREKKLSIFRGVSSRPITKSEASLAWKHLLFLEKASKSTKPSLALEDDCLFLDNFLNVVNEILSSNTDWDVVFPGSGCNLRANGKGLIRVPHPASKCTDSYLIKPDAASKIFSSLRNDVQIAIDWELNSQMAKHDLKVFWHEPPITRQRSQDGTLASSINGKKENIYK